MQKMKNYIYIKCRVVSKIFYLTLARPTKRNAFTPTMVAEMADALNFAQAKQNIWLIIIDAEGPVFCAGMDLKVFQNPDLDQKNIEVPITNLSLGEVMATINKPIIAKVEGPVMAGGFLIIAESTFVIATQNASFSLPEVQRGIFPLQVMHAMSKIMPQRKILEMCILAKTYSASEATELGIVTHLFDDKNFENDLNNLANNILAGAPLAIAKGIEVSKVINNVPENEKYQFLKAELEVLRITADVKEGINAFIEKRNPVWKNI
jgi:enoyl-CoA hydratase/carnithine racemase